MNKNESFPGYPHLKRVTYSERYGKMELIEVNETSDGFLIGMARISDGYDSYFHSVFLGEKPKFKIMREDMQCDKPKCKGKGTCYCEYAKND